MWAFWRRIWRLLGGVGVTKHGLIRQNRTGNGSENASDRHDFALKSNYDQASVSSLRGALSASPADLLLGWQSGREQLVFQRSEVGSGVMAEAALGPARIVAHLRAYGHDVPRVWWDADGQEATGTCTRCGDGVLLYYNPDRSTCSVEGTQLARPVLAAVSCSGSHGAQVVHDGWTNPERSMISRSWPLAKSAFSNVPIT